MKRTITLTLLLTVLLLSACSPQAQNTPTPNPGQSVSSDDTPVPTPTLGADMLLDEKAIVESIEVLMLESFPLQVHVNVKGQLPDGCTTVYDSWSGQTGDYTFEVHIQTARPQDAMCTQALVPFEENVALDVYGLPAGTYTVVVYDQEASFTFQQDNILPE